MKTATIRLALTRYGLGQRDPVFTRPVMGALYESARSQFALTSIQAETPGNLAPFLCFAMAMLERCKGRMDAPVFEWRDEIHCRHPH